MKMHAIAASLAMIALMSTDAAVADPGGKRGAKFDYAEVISSEPIIRYVTVRTPVRECWQDTRVRIVQKGGGKAQGSLIGAVIGGVIGNQFGSGRGNDAATVAGALIGAAKGAQASRDPETVRYEEPIERCETTITEREEERIDGYRVLYVYNGQRYSTRLPYDPGQRLRVRVDVRPAD